VKGIRSHSERFSSVAEVIGSEWEVLPRCCALGCLSVLCPLLAIFFFHASRIPLSCHLSSLPRQGAGNVRLDPGVSLCLPRCLTIFLLDSGRYRPCTVRIHKQYKTIGSSIPSEVKVSTGGRKPSDNPGLTVIILAQAVLASECAFLRLCTLPFSTNHRDGHEGEPKPTVVRASGGARSE
jgi:hypothetical protein